MTPSSSPQASAPITTVAASIGDWVWDDSNGDGVQDSGENGLAGVVISLTLPGGTVIATTTDVSGTYQFNNLHSGNYTVTVDSSTLPAWYYLTTNNQPLTVTLSAGESYTSADFGYQEKGYVTGHLYIDTNGNSTQDSGEPDLDSVDIIVTDSTGVTQTVTSDASGNYTATVPPGSTTVNVDETDADYPTGYTQTEGTDPTTVTAVTGTDTSAGNDGYQPPFQYVTGVIYIDIDSDGIYSSTVDTLLPNITVWITDSTGVTYIAVTNGSGVYSQTVPLRLWPR